MATIFALSSQPRVPSSGFDIQLVAIAGHLIAYGVLAITLLVAFEQTGIRSHQSALLALGGAAVYGLTDELHQYFVPGRHADPLDLITNGIGAAIFLSVFNRVRA